MTRKLIFLCLVLSGACQAEALKPINMSDAIEQLIQQNMPTAEVGIAVGDAQTGKTLYQRNSYQNFTPASNTKLFSGAAALYHLGENFTFNTKVRAKKSKIQSKTLNGNLYLTFAGDPSFRTSHLKKLMLKVHDKITVIKGNVVIDTSRFSGPVYAPGWSQEDLAWYFNAPVTSDILNQNTIDVNIIPGSMLGNHTKFKIVNKDLSPYFKVNGNVTTVTYPKAEKHCSLYVQNDSNNNFKITGCWPISNKAKTLHFAVKNPDLLMKQFITTQLKKNNIALSGNIVFGKTPANLQVIAEHKSRPLKLLLLTLLKDSNNLYADALTKTLGKMVYGTGSLQEGVNAIKNILHAKANLDFNNIVIKDGCGGSRYNLISPNQIVRLLFVINHSPKIAKLFKNALPESGKNGTLKNRMKSFDLKGKLFAKTGSMAGISTLSGYLTTRNNQQIIFSIMINHVVGNISEARILQTKIASVLYAEKA